MKLVIATGLYPPDIGGPATYTVFLEKHLPRHGIELSVLPFGSVRNIPKLIRHVVYMFKLMRASHGATALYALDTVSVGLPACIAGMFTRKPLLLRVPGDYAWEQGRQRFGLTETLDEYLVHKKSAPWQVRMLAWIQALVAKKASHIIVPSDYMKDIVKKWGIPEKKITRIYSVLKSINVQESKEVLRERFRYTNFTVISAGRLVPWKGMEALIDAVSELREEGCSVSLDILGDGVCRTVLEERIRNRGSGSYIRLRGALDRDTMAQRIKAADVFVLNTSYEGLSHQLIEVMEIGTPIVTTPVGGNPELIAHERTGLMTPYNDVPKLKEAVRRIYTDASFGMELTEKAGKELHRFEEGTVIREFTSLVQAVWKS